MEWGCPVWLENVGPNGETRQEQRIQYRLDNIHAGYLSVIAYNQFWYNEYINNQAEQLNQRDLQLNQQSLMLNNEQIDAVRCIINKILDQVENI
ncbi:unnamed protein product [Rotaria sp. Silwood1]|nr:unnamed protein product [Rotaria sp. Silwood1]CAF1620859.1 unnamed protein product [Rotaria sp. Silwood1]